QWPLKGESLEQAHLLMNEQFKQGHLKLSTSPWNTPIFVIKKKSGKFRLLHDLRADRRAVNDQMESMGALQRGQTNPAMLPHQWPLLIIDLKDCFFTIHLHPDDTQRFAFTLPALNREGPDKQFEWTVLPQGMKNSPTLCQLFVDAVLQPLRKAWPTTLIYHYMDDILFAQEQLFSDMQIQQIKTTLERNSLIIAPEKVQRTPSWKYLGWTITEQTIAPQKLQINSDIRTLRDAQRLLGDLQWLCPIVGIPNELLDSLRPLLQG
ncbi:Putative Pol polyprotein, partial [Merops nubicus]